MRDSEGACTTIESLAINASPEHTGVNTSLSEACEQVTVLGAHYKNSTLALPQADLQNLTDYFSRPVYINGGTITPGVRNRLYATDFVSDSMFQTYFPQGFNRLFGVYGVRFTLVFTLHVNTTPFHQGLLALNWQYGAFSDATLQQHFVRSRYSASCTNIPHVRLDLSVNTSAQLRIPFLFQEEFMRIHPNTRCGNLPYGLLALNTILPSETVEGLAPAEWRILAHIEDLQLFGAMPREVSTVVAQSGGSKPMNREFEDDTKPYSSGFHALSRSMRFLARGVPALSSIAGPASWFLEKTAGAVRAFGFSRPLVQEPPMRILPVDTAYELNVDQPFPGVVLGPIAANQLRVDPSLAFSDVDEMSLSYVLSQWSQLCVFRWGTASPHTTLLWAGLAGPSSLWFRAPSTTPALSRPAYVSSGTAANSFLPTSIFFASQMFRQWRGALRYRFTFAKTKMHGGRVLASFLPKIFEANPTATDTFGAVSFEVPDHVPFAYSATFDLRDDNVFEFVVPYVHSSPYLLWTEAMGSVSLRVLDSLLAPAVVAPFINVLVEVKAEPDFELCIPARPRFPAATMGTIRLEAGGLATQVASSSEVSVGEAITSFKQLIQMPKSRKVTTTIPTSATNVALALFPWYYQPIPNGAVPPPTDYVIPVESFGFAGNIAKCYAFARGSTDYHLYVTDHSAASAMSPLTISHVPREQFPTTSTGTVVNNYFNGSRSQLSTVVALENTPLHVRIPGYAKGPRIPTFAWDKEVWEGGVPSTTGVDSYNIPPVSGPAGIVNQSPMIAEVRAQVTHAAGSTNFQCTLWSSRSAGDDAILGHYMGPPPLFTPNDNSTAADYDIDVRWV